MFTDFVPSTPVKHVASRDVHLWLIDSRDVHDKNVIHDLLCLLPEDEKIRLTQFRKSEKQHLFLVTRAAVRLILNGLVNQPSARDLTFTRNSFGKPALAENDSNIHFNLSHSGHMVVIAVTVGRECGVDIERINPGRNILELAKFYYHPHEVDALQKAGDSYAALLLFYKLWALKEAFIKAEGKGMAIPGDGFRFRHPHTDAPDVVVNHPTIASEHRWTFNHQFYSDAFSIALAVGDAGDKSQPDDIIRRRLLFTDIY